MNIKAILAKLTKGEDLSAEEKDFLSKYDPERDENRIPKSRLDQEIQKRSDIEKQLQEATEKLSALQSQLDEIGSKGLSESEKLKKEYEKNLAASKSMLEKLTKERDDAVAEFSKSKFNSAVSQIAAKHKFSDPDYLGFLVKSSNVNLDDSSAVDSFIKDLASKSPNLFATGAKPGSGAIVAGSETGSSDQQRLRDLLAKSDLTARDVAEVAKLESQINQSKQNSPNT